MFEGYPTYDRYRALYLPAAPAAQFKGEDVYALQTACAALGHSPGTLDGHYGPATDRAVRATQTTVKTAPDGRVGPNTWTAITNALAVPARQKYNIAEGLLYGQLAHESGMRGGMVSSPPRPDGTFDAGVAQRNTAYHDLRSAFTMPDSIDLLAKTIQGDNGKTIAGGYGYYYGVADQRRRWGIAAGSWNAPYFANWLAWESGATHIPAARRVNPDRYTGARAKIEQYITSVTAYLRV